jgi:hypothetical protein
MPVCSITSDFRPVLSTSTTGGFHEKTFCLGSAVDACVGLCPRNADNSDTKPYTTGDLLSKRQLTIRYIIFYILFLPDSWQVLTGLIAAYFLTPLIVGLPDTGYGGRAMLFIMIAVIGYAASGVPARRITRFLIKWSKYLSLGAKRP